MTPGYAVVEADPRTVESDLARIWRDNLPIPVEAGARFDWTRRAPEPASGVFVLTADEDGARRIVGSAGVIERPFYVRGEPARGAQLVDLAVDRAHRTLGPALALVRETRRAVVPRHDLAYGFPNASARPLFRRAGYRELGSPTRWVAVLRYAPYLERYAGRRAATLAGGLLDAASAALRAPRQRRSAARWTLSWTDRADARFDALWAGARSGYDVIGCRDASYLDWRFFDNPACTAEAAVLGERGGRMRAYAIVEHRERAAHIVDLFGERDVVGNLLDLLLPALRRRGATSASFAFLGGARTRSLLAAHGFSPREQGPALLFDASTAEITESLATPDRWYLTEADDDV